MDLLRIGVLVGLVVLLFFWFRNTEFGKGIIGLFSGLGKLLGGVGSVFGGVGKAAGGIGGLL